MTLRRSCTAYAAVLSLSVFALTPARAQIRVLDYNTGEGARAGIEKILAAVGAEWVNGIAKPVDVITLQEQTSSATTTQAILDVLNGLYGAGTYARATLDGQTNGSGSPGLIYNTRTIQLIAQTTASITSLSGAARQTLRYQLRPVGYGAAADFYVFSSHYKATNDVSSISRRGVEAQQVRANADALGNAHIIYAGDFNIYTSAEPMYQTLLAPGNGQAFDPINRPGDWSSNALFKDIHTQSPVTTQRYSAQITGGMDDRFDFQLVSAEFLDDEGLSYLAGSYHTFGNTGTHIFNGEITSGSALALQARLPGYTLAQAQDVLNALTQVSDHLPVVADYQVPARMGVEVDPFPPLVIRDAALTANMRVRNTAAVVAAHGADELDYQVVASGALSGSTAGTDAALGGANTHVLSLATAMVGRTTAFLGVNSSSQAVADGTFTLGVAVDVLDHANPSFSTATDENDWTLDFGTHLPGSGTQRLDFTLANLVSLLGPSAKLDLDTSSGSGDTLQLSTGVQPFKNLASRGALTLGAFFATDTPGDFRATYTFGFSDEDLPGAVPSAPLILTLIGQVIPEPGTPVLFLMALAGVALRTRARRR